MMMHAANDANTTATLSTFWAKSPAGERKKERQRIHTIEGGTASVMPMMPSTILAGALLLNHFEA